jgi:hypothetical protein
MRPANTAGCRRRAGSWEHRYARTHRRGGGGGGGATTQHSKIVDRRQQRRVHGARRGAPPPRDALVHGLRMLQLGQLGSGQVGQLVGQGHQLLPRFCVLYPPSPQHHRRANHVHSPRSPRAHGGAAPAPSPQQNHTPHCSTAHNAATEQVRAGAPGGLSHGNTGAASTAPP